MSDRVSNSRPGGSITNRPAGKRANAGPPLKTKAEKRAEAKAAKARARAARRRRRLLVGIGTPVVVVLLVVGAVLLISHAKHTSESAGPAPSSTQFPPVPAGADPALRTKPTVTAGSGTLDKLTVTPLITGTGEAVQAGQTITVNYVGVTYKDGKEFDSSWKNSQAFSFQLGAGKVIPGWDQGLVGVKVGSRVQLDIPAKLAYGDNPPGGQPPGALRFVVDVLSAS